MDQRVLLLILDGWGLGSDPTADAIHQAETPNFDRLYSSYPSAQLVTHGKEVGLPEGQMGNSEVGHLNIGAGRIVHQDLVKINQALTDGSFFAQNEWQGLLSYAEKEQKPIHILGLVSDGGVHSQIDHLLGLIEWLGKHTTQPVYLHAFTDGRDTDPKSGKGFIAHIQTAISTYPHIQLASVIGRYYAMDRDHRWERIAKAYELLTRGKGTQVSDFSEAIQTQYDEGQTDEFLNPLWHASLGRDAQIKAGDAVFFLNFRTDRPRQLTRALTQEEFPDYNLYPIADLHYLTMTRYDDTFTGLHVLFDKENLKDTLGEIISRKGKTQLRIAETEKYPHVTFFFSGGRETPFEGEERIMIHSPKVATYDLQPEMSAYEVSNAMEEMLLQQNPSFICLNYANADMVGHTGDFEAAKKAAQAVDRCVGSNVALARQKGYHTLIIADHGNSDMLLNPDGSPNTAHTKNPVPMIYIPPANHTEEEKSLTDGILADVAPTILSLLKLSQPKSMTGQSLLS